MSLHLRASVAAMVLLLGGMAPASAQGNDPLTRFLNDLFNEQPKAATPARDRKGARPRPARVAKAKPTPPLPPLHPTRIEVAAAEPLAPEPVEAAAAVPDPWDALELPPEVAEIAVPPADAALIVVEAAAPAAEPPASAAPASERAAEAAPPVSPSGETVEASAPAPVTSVQKAEAPAPVPAPVVVASADGLTVAAAIAEPPQAPIVRAAAPQQPAVPTTPAAAIERINAYFNSIDVLTAAFVQSSGGQRSTGTLQLKRPGQLRFAYAPPSTLEIVSDGRSVAIRDKKLGTNDVYPIGQTPLKFLLQERFDLARDTKVRNVQTNPDGLVVVRFDDSATFGGTSKVTLQFDARRNRLKEWTVVDPQGYETNVVLSNVEVGFREAKNE